MNDFFDKNCQTCYFGYNTDRHCPPIGTNNVDKYKAVDGYPSWKPKTSRSIKIED